MPRLSAYALRAALLYLLVGFTFGALILTQKGLQIWPWAWQLLNAHMEFLLVGWSVQLAMGVAYWILPRITGGSRGNTRLAWAAFLLLNAGVLAAALAGTTRAATAWMPAGRALEVLAAAAFALHAWRRVRPSA